MLTWCILVAEIGALLLTEIGALLFSDYKQIRLYQKLGFKKHTTIKDFFIDNYPEPIYENGKQLIDMVVLKKDI